jgi:hypothetical protein
MFDSFRKATFLLLGLLLTVTLLQGQDLSKGSIAGVVRDPGNAVLPRTTVILKSQSGDRVTTTGADGEYSFLNLTAGAGYAISVSGSGFEPVTVSEVAVHANQRTTLDIVLRPEGTAQAVALEPPQSNIDYSAAQTAVNLGESLFQRVPVERNVSAVLSMAPGLADGSAGQGAPSISGASGMESQFLVNGANATDPVYGGLGPAHPAYGSMGSGVNFDFLKQAQVLTAGADARYGQSTGGTVNLVTKSGSNTFHGSLFGYFQPREFEAMRPDGNRLTVSQRTRIVNEGRYDFGGELGGYLLRDKLFFYGGINPQFLRSYRQAPSIFANSRLGEVAVKSRNWNYTGKLTWNLSARHQLEGSIFGDPGATPMGFTRPYSLASDDTLAQSKLNFGSRIWTGRYNGEWHPNWLLNANFSRYTSRFRETPRHDAYAVIDNTAVQAATGGQRITGGLGLLENNDTHGNQFSWASTHRANWLGSHTIQYGYQFEDVGYDRFFRYTGPQFTLPNIVDLGPAAGATQYGAQLVRRYIDASNPSAGTMLEVWGGNYSIPSAAASTRYQAGFLEDSWTFSRRLTVRPGLRFEQQSLGGNAFRYRFGGNLAPRIGVIYDPSADRRSKIFFHWGRFYERIPAALATRAFSGESWVRGAAYRDTGGTIDLSPANYLGGATLLFSGAPGMFIAPVGGARAPYQDELTAGYEREFGRTLTFSGRFIRRDLRRVLEDVSPLSLTQFESGMTQRLLLANPSRKLDLFGGPAGPDGRPDGFADPRRAYTAMELVASKRFGTNWQTFANYRLSKLTGNYEGLYFAGSGMLAPNLSPLFDFTNTDGRMSDQFRGGVLPLDRRHALKLFTSYQFSEGWLKRLSIGGGWNIESGTPISRYMAHPAYNTPGSLLSGSRGSLGRTGWTYPVDFHADYTWQIAEGKNVKFVADLFNAFNQKTLIRVDQNFQLDKFTPNPDFLKPNTAGFANPYQTPFHARLGVRFEF